MYRKIMENLAAWKDDKNRKPLLVTGVRQCGKTYTIREFGEKYFEDLAYFNFESSDLLADVFAHDFNIDRILDELGNMIRGKEIQAGRTLVFFDEIQACPRAITALKYFCENKRELHVICAGSLLGVAVKREPVSFPVGKINRLQMYPMCFSEFLEADGSGKYKTGIRKYALDAELPELYTVPLEKELRAYYVVGGMPEAVACWVESHNIAKVEEIQKAILQDYMADFSKHAPLVDVPKLGWIWDSVPAQLAKDNKKFIFSHVKAGKRAAELEDALQWLKDAGLIYRHELVENPELPLAGRSNASWFKVYLSDVGLLRAKAGIAPRILLGEPDGLQTFKGAFVENFVLTELLSEGLHPYFWASRNTAELDFIFEYDGEVIPVEAKAEIHTRAKSFRNYCGKYCPKLGFRISMKNVGINFVQNTKTVSLPLYLIWRIKDYLAMP